MLVHVALVVFLVLMTVANAAPQHEGGIEVMFGDFELAGEGIGTPSALAEAPLLPDETLASEDQPLLTQDEEPSVAIDENTESVKEQESPEPEKTKEQLRAEHERRVAAQADKLMSSAFGKGASMGGGGDGGAEQVAGPHRVDAHTGKAARQGRDLPVAVVGDQAVVPAVDPAVEIALRLRVADQVDGGHAGCSSLL